MSPKPLVTYVVPCFNEERCIGEFYRRVCEVAEQHTGHLFEFLFVNDGSQDETQALLDGLAKEDRRVKVVHLARNRGHQLAVTAGLDYASGDVVVIIDADLQDPPELLSKMLAKLRDGYDIVHAQRRARKGETVFKLTTAKLFYKLMKHLVGGDLVEDSGDFRAISRRALEAARGFREPHRFLRGMFASLGFHQAIVQYDRDERFADETKYPLGTMIRLASNAVLSYSTVPIRGILWLAVTTWLISLVYLGKALYERMVLGITVPGWTSMIVMLSLYAGLILFCISIVGAYVARIFEQGQKRPMYWIQGVRNLDLSSFSEPRGESREVWLSSQILKHPVGLQIDDDRVDEA
ncbi:glycosyltransferase family 2 protein [Pseudomonadota bacterium]